MWLTHMGDLPLDISLLRVHFCDDVPLCVTFMLCKYALWWEIFFVISL